MRKTTEWLARRPASFMAVAIALATTGAWAAQVYWTGDVNNYWDEQGNWRGQGSSRPLPTNDDAYFTNDGKYKNNEVVFTNFCENAYRSYVRNVGTAEEPLVFRATGSDCGLRFGNNTSYNYPSYIGDSAGNTYLRLVNGTWRASFLFVGRNSSHKGHLELKDIKEFHIGKALEVLNGSCVLDGGSITLYGGDWSRLGNGSGTVADFTIADGSVTISGSGDSCSLYIGNGSGNSRDAVTMTVKKGGSFTATGNARALCVGRGSPGTLNIEGGLVTLWNLNFCFEDGGAGSVANITEGGVLYTDQIKVVKTSKDATLNIDGGKIKPRNNNNLFDAAYTGLHVYVGAKGAEFDGSGMLNNKTGYTILEDIEDKAGEKGVVKFTSGKTVTLSGSGKQWTGGTTIALGTKVIATTAAAKAAVIENGLTIDASDITTAGDYTVFQYDGGELTDDVLEEISYVNCGPETTKEIVNGNTIVVHFTPLEFTLDGKKTWSELIDGVELTSDVVVLIKVVDGNHTLTIDTDVTVGQIEFTDGTGSTLAIAEGKKLTVVGITGIGAVLNHGTLDKKGNGTLSIPFDAGSRGVFVVNAGTLQASANGKNRDDAGGLITGDPDADSRPNFLIDVKSGAVFDVNGKYDVSAAVRLAEGAQFKNSGSNVNNEYGQVIQLILDGNAKIFTPNGEHIFAILARGTSHKLPTRIDLGEHTLEIACSGKEFALNKTTIIGSGTIAVTSGRFCTRNFDSKGEDCTLEIGANGTFENNKTFKVKNFVNNGTIAYSSDWGRGELQVTGNFESKTASFPALKLIGATIKARSSAVVTILDKFSTSGAITIDASEICDAVKSAEDQRIRVLTIPKTSYKDEFKSWDIVPKDGSMLRLRWLPDGDAKMALYVCRSRGTRIIVR